MSATRRKALLVGLSAFLLVALLSPLVGYRSGFDALSGPEGFERGAGCAGPVPGQHERPGGQVRDGGSSPSYSRRRRDGSPEDIVKSEKDLAASQQQLADRLVNVYKEGRSPTPMYLEVLFSATDISAVIDRLSLLSKVAGQDQALYAQVQKHLDKRKVLQQDLAKKEKVQSQQLVDLKNLQVDMETKMSAAAGQYKALKKRVTDLKAEAARQAAAAAAAAVAAKKAAKKKPGVQPGSFVFPVDGPHSYADTWGAPRSGGPDSQGL